MAEQILPANPLHRQAPLLAHGTKGGRTEREREEEDLSTERGEDSGDDGGEEEWG